MLRSSWAPGPAAGIAGPALVSVTEFQARSRLDLPGIVRAGFTLRRAWPGLIGAVGMWLWIEPSRGTCGSVAIWQDEAALRRFVARPEHVVIMRRYRGRGQLRSTTWSVAHPDLAEAWARARSYLSGGERRPAS